MQFPSATVYNDMFIVNQQNFFANYENPKSQVFFNDGSKTSKDYTSLNSFHSSFLLNSKGPLFLPEPGHCLG